MKARTIHDRPSHALCGSLQSCAGRSGQLARLYEKKRKKGSPFLSCSGMQVGMLLAHVNAQELLRIPLPTSFATFARRSTRIDVAHVTAAGALVALELRSLRDKQTTKSIVSPQSCVSSF